MKKTVGVFAAMMMVSVCICPWIGYAQTGDPDEVVASVDGVTCLRKDLDKTVGDILAGQNVPAEQQAAVRKRIEQAFINSFVMRTLLKNEAEREGLTVTGEDREKQEARVGATLKVANKTLDQYFKESPFGEEKARKEFEITILIEKLIQLNVTAHIKVDDAEVEQVMKAAEAIGGLQPPPALTADKVREGLTQQKAIPATRAYLNELKAKATIKAIIPIDPYE